MRGGSVTQKIERERKEGSERSERKERKEREIERDNLTLESVRIFCDRTHMVIYVSI
jgi:hypothetical protein